MTRSRLSLRMLVKLLKFTERAFKVLRVSFIVSQFDFETVTFHRNAYLLYVRVVSNKVLLIQLFQIPYIRAQLGFYPVKISQELQQNSVYVYSIFN